MIRSPGLKWAAFAGLLAGLLTISFADAAGKQEEAKKYAAQLRTSKDVKKKVEALEELGKLGQIQKALVADVAGDIAESLNDKDASIRKAGAEAYGRIDPDPNEAVPSLTKLLKDDKDEGVRIGAAHGLAYMRDSAKEALPALREVAKAYKDDKKSKLGRAASDAVRAIQPKKK